MLVKKTVTQTVEVTLPYFSVNDDGVFKEYYSIHEDLSINVLVSDNGCFISISNNPSKIQDAIKGEPITEMDFDFAYQMAIERLQKSVKPTTEKV